MRDSGVERELELKTSARRSALASPQLPDPGPLRPGWGWLPLWLASPRGRSPGLPSPNGRCCCPAVAGGWRCLALSTWKPSCWRSSERLASGRLQASSGSWPAWACPPAATQWTTSGTPCWPLVYPWCCRTDSLSLFVVFVSPGCSLSARSLFSGCLLRRLPQARGGGSGVSNCFIGGSVRRSAGCHVGQATVCYVGGWQWIVGLACLFLVCLASRWPPWLVASLGHGPRGPGVATSVSLSVHVEAIGWLHGPLSGWFSRALPRVTCFPRGADRSSILLFSGIGPSGASLGPCVGRRGPRPRPLAGCPGGRSVGGDAAPVGWALSCSTCIGHAWHAAVRLACPWLPAPPQLCSSLFAGLERWLPHSGVVFPSRVTVTPRPALTRSRVFEF